jgi:hypothetical protein
MFHESINCINPMGAFCVAQFAGRFPTDAAQQWFHFGSKAAVRGSAALGNCSSCPNLTMENNVLNELSALSQSFSSRLILVDEYPERRNVRHLRDRICCRTLSSL